MDFKITNTKTGLMLLLSFLGITRLAVGQEIRTFQDTRIINGHSVEVEQKGVLKFIIAHRFGFLNEGFYELYGLDQSIVRYGLDFGLTERLTIGGGRTSDDATKLFDTYVKYKAIDQKRQGSPVTLTLLQNLSVNGSRWLIEELNDYLVNRLSYNTQILIASKISDRLSVQLMPVFSHKNFVLTREESNDLFLLGYGVRFRVSKTIAIQGEYYQHLIGDMAHERQESLSFGFEFETKGHVFQLHLSNARGMSESIFLRETRGKWGNGDFGLGFNITRNFQVGKRRTK